MLARSFEFLEQPAEPAELEQLEGWALISREAGGDRFSGVLEDPRTGASRSGTTW